ncbi:MAG: hypothetical protein QOH39_3115 [Verrucomicrobiota bacterium]|jgi:hypothetical protein
MKKHFALGFLLVGLTAGSLFAGDFQSIRPDNGGDTIQPVPPASDAGPPNLPAAAVPEPSTICLLAGSALFGAGVWFRRRRRS